MRRASVGHWCGALVVALLAHTAPALAQTTTSTSTSSSTATTRSPSTTTTTSTLPKPATDMGKLSNLYVQLSFCQTSALARAMSRQRKEERCQQKGPAKQGPCLAQVEKELEKNRRLLQRCEKAAQKQAALDVTGCGVQDQMRAVWSEVLCDLPELRKDEEGVEGGEDPLAACVPCTTGCPKARRPTDRARIQRLLGKNSDLSCPATALLDFGRAGADRASCYIVAFTTGIANDIRKCQEGTTGQCASSAKCLERLPCFDLATRCKDATAAVDAFATSAVGSCAEETAGETLCDDENPCTADACDAGHCTHTPINEGGSCPDTPADNQCLANKCQAGACVDSTDVKPNGTECLNKCNSCVSAVCTRIECVNPQCECFDNDGCLNRQTHLPCN